MKQLLIALVLVAALVALAQMYVAGQTYTPVTRLASPDGMTFTTVQDTTSERTACGAANDRFLQPIKQQCKDCEIVFARCERDYENVESALSDIAGIPHHQVRAPGIRVHITGPEAPAKFTCEYIAQDMAKRGLHSSCIPPASKSS